MSKKLEKFDLYRVVLLKEIKLEVLQLGLKSIYCKYYDFFEHNTAATIIIIKGFNSSIG